MAVGAAAWLATRGWGPEQENCIIRALQQEPGQAAWHQRRLADGDRQSVGFALLFPFVPCLPAAVVRKLGPA
eukprot:15448358-Alexandrium_andersonii.AAC.1